MESAKRVSCSAVSLCRMNRSASDGRGAGQLTVPLEEVMMRLKRLCAMACG
jgi:hypothetical protein